MQRQNECHTWRFKLIQSVSASKEVMRSRHSSAWPIPFYEQLRTSQSGTAADPHGESSLRGTEAICLYSGPVGKSHTVGAGQREEEGKEEKKFKLTDFILYLRMYLQSPSICFSLFKMINFQHIKKSDILTTTQKAHPHALCSSISRCP